MAYSEVFLFELPFTNKMVDMGVIKKDIKLQLLIVDLLSNLTIVIVGNGVCLIAAYFIRPSGYVVYCIVAITMLLLFKPSKYEYTLSSVNIKKYVLKHSICMDMSRFNMLYKATVLGYEEKTVKKIYEYDMLERYAIDVEKTNAEFHNKTDINEYDEQEYCKLIGETEKYMFYSYKTYTDGSGGYILRQEKERPEIVVYFGESRIFNCIFGNILFQVNDNDETGFFNVLGKNVETGKVYKFNWFSPNSIFVNATGYGRFFCQDTVKKVYVENDKLFFEVSRRKSSDPFHEYEGNPKYDVDMDYTLTVTYNEGKLKVVASYPSYLAL